ncbi:hypothetical protein B0T25DRAFT_173513 [Lasiosphaeria hispida]|uniref:Uncharacterized protein n=1 Tax=Lasiosphaeria hispida TaxID=260671 RepID=A0AAJ0HN20_9PEZI|nr:hypothetical protein B0T25DRAFT_173513 [Lasiosphaeria hispida]
MDRAANQSTSTRMYLVRHAVGLGLIGLIAHKVSTVATCTMLAECCTLDCVQPDYCERTVPHLHMAGRRQPRGRQSTRTVERGGRCGRWKARGRQTTPDAPRSGILGCGGGHPSAAVFSTERAASRVPGRNDGRRAAARGVTANRARGALANGARAQRRSRTVMHRGGTLRST